MTRQVVQQHLSGRSPLGIYLLHRTYVHMATVDFDEDDVCLPRQFVERMTTLGVPSYVERSKSKGYHVWMYFSEWVKAWKPRVVLQWTLREMGCPETEVFPKQDRLTTATAYGNFINLPLFGGLAGKGKTVFLDESFEPVPDQWSYIRRIRETSVDVWERVIGANRLRPVLPADRREVPHFPGVCVTGRYNLPPCVRRMLAEGVRAYQRVACFRIAVQMRKAGLPYHQAVAILLAWRPRNRPAQGKSIIRESEIRNQTRCAYKGRGYRACGCEDPAVQPFCDPGCSVRGGGGQFSDLLRSSPRSVSRRLVTVGSQSHESVEAVRDSEDADSSEA